MKSKLFGLFFIAVVSGTSYEIGYEGRDDRDPQVHENWSLIDEEQCGSSLSDRIIGGVNASIGQYPWLARIGYASNKTPRTTVMYRCGGSLITLCYVLTAAHCVSGLPPGLVVAGVRLGEFDSETDVDCNSHVCADAVQDFFPKRIMMHREYGLPTFKNDIALIVLDQPAILSKFVMPICLPRGSLLNKDLVGSMAEVAGWGVYDLKVSTGSRILQTVKLPIVERERCTEAFRRHAIVDDQQWCVGGVIGHDSCGGDSGGPLMKVDVLDGRTPRYYLFGVVSFGAKYCGTSTMPAVYTKIASYINWILDNIKQCD